MMTELGYLPRLQSREEFVDYLEGFVTPAVVDLERGKSRKLLKTYMLETARHDHAIPELASLFSDGITLQRLDDTMYRVEDADHGGNVVGLLESLDDRHPVFYTTMAADDSKKWVRHVVDRCPWLDHLWLSSSILFELWQYVQRSTPNQRYVRLGFDHEAWYETTSDPRDLYDPLHSLVQLQIPGGERGGHLFYHDGRATDRSNSFIEHRATVALVLGLYRRITEHAELQLWVDTTDVGQDGITVTGAPLTIRFGEPLSATTFDRHLWGTCGNTVHRLVTNVQRYLDPKAEVWLGSERYDEAVAKSMSTAV